MSILPQIEGGYLVNQGMLLKVDDVNVDVVEINGGRRARKKYNYEPFQPKILPNLDGANQKRKLRSQSQEAASTGSEEEVQKDKQSKKRRDVARSKSLAASDRPTQLSEESRSIFTKYAGVAKAQQRSRLDENNNSVKSHTKSRSTDSNTEQHVRFNDDVQETYPEVHIREARPTLSPIPSKPIPGYLKQTRSSGNKVKLENEVSKPPRTLDKINNVGNGDINGASDEPETMAIPRRPLPSRFKAPPPGGPTHHERLREERRRARLWRETASDPGNTEKSIHNDHVIKGRQSQNKRKHPNANRHDERPRGADRGRRMQSLPSRKEGQDSENDRPVNSAPSKELPKSDGPMPKLNNLVSKPQLDDKESPKPVLKDKEKTIESSVKERTSPNFTQSQSPRKPPPQDERPKQQVKRPGADSKLDSTETVTEKKTTVKLPPDDHGPVLAPVEKELPVEPAVEKRENFNYYATEKEPDSDRQRVEEKPKPKEALQHVRLHTEKSIKIEKPDQRGRRDISPSKSPGRSRDISPAKTPRRDLSPGKYLKTFDKAKTMTERTEPSEYSDNSRKKREVTIMDPKDVRREMEMDGVEGFPQEYEMPYHRRSKTFEEMTDEEKVNYFKQELKLRPEQIRELTFHPRVTEPKQIHRAYTGMETLNWSSKSARLKSAKRAKSRNAMIYRKVSMVPPSQRKSHMLSKLQGVVYRHINKVYGSTSKNAREKQFFERLAELQLREYQKRYEMLAENEQKQLEMKYKQREQLRSLRKKFEDDAWRRFMTQYVTSKVLESEFRDRSEYGLPNDLHSKPHGARSKRHIYTMTPKSRYRANRKKYANMFNFNTGPEMKQGGKPLKFEGFDAIYIDTEDEHGSPTKKRQDVQSLMEEALDLLHAHDDDSDIELSPRRDVRKQSEPAVRRWGRPDHRPPRKSEPAMRSYDRPRHSMSRFKPYSEGRSVRTISTKRSEKNSQRSRPRQKTKIKTMRELYDKRNPLPGNRYRASEFNAMKQNLIKDHELLNRKQRDNDKKPTKNTIDRKTEDKVEQRTERTNISKQGPPPPDIKQIKPPQGLQKTESAKSRLQNGNVHLDDPQTQVGIDYEREKVSDEHTKPSQVADTNKSNTTKTVTTVTTTTTTTTKTVSPDKKSGGSESVAETVSIKEDRRSIKEDRRSSVSSQRRASVPNIQSTFPRKPLSRTPSMTTVREMDTDQNAKPVQRTPSRASIFSVSQRRRPSVSQPPRAPTRESVATGDKTTVDKAGTGRVSRASVISTKQQKEPNDTEAVDSKDSVITVADVNKKTGTPVINGHVSNGSGGSPVTVTLGGSDGRVSPVVSMSNNLQESTEPLKSRRNSIRDSQVNLRRPSISQSPTKSNQSRSIKEPSPNTKEKNNSEIHNGSIENGQHVPENGTKVDVKRAEHMSEVVTEVVQNQRKSRSPGKSDSLKPSRSVDDENISRSKSVQGRASRASLAESKRRSLPAQNKENTLVNGHDDTTMKREDYEKAGQDRNQSKAPRRSRSRDKKGRKRSTSRSRERKRSTSRDKKKGKGKTTGRSRFPDIENRPNSIAGRSPSRDNTKTKVSKDVKETVTEREVTPQGGADQWRDLVQKYMRQPSPKIGKADNRAFLDASFDTDDDEDDIFARAQKRYALSISDDEIV